MKKPNEEALARFVACNVEMLQYYREHNGDEILSLLLSRRTPTRDQTVGLDKGPYLVDIGTIHKYVNSKRGTNVMLGNTARLLNNLGIEKIRMSVNGKRDTYYRINKDLNNSYEV